MKILKATLLGAAIVIALGACAGTVTTDKSGTRSVETAIDDATITGSVKSKLLADERTKGFDINVDTARGVVTLTGGADSQASKNTAGSLAASATGVVRVKNQLVVAAAGSERREDANTATASGDVREAMDESGDGVDDGWITTKVKSQLLADPGTKGLNIMVETHANIVHLSGVAATAASRELAISIARNTRGVRGVDATRLRIGN
ncbi:MAG: BON domain-containing protein [Arenimonas sp.]|nr:BON domain-containing protein [Arenimonas sp.]